MSLFNLVMAAKPRIPVPGTGSITFPGAGLGGKVVMFGQSSDGSLQNPVIRILQEVDKLSWSSYTPPGFAAANGDTVRCGSSASGNTTVFLRTTFAHFYSDDGHGVLTHLIDLPGTSNLSGNGIAVTDDGTYTCYCDGSNILYLYKNVSGTVTKLTSPTSTTSRPSLVEFSSDNNFLILSGQSGANNVAVYHRSGDVFTQLFSSLGSLQYATAHMNPAGTHLIVIGYDGAKLVIQLYTVSGTTFTFFGNLTTTNVPAGFMAESGYNFKRYNPAGDSLVIALSNAFSQQPLSYSISGNIYTQRVPGLPPGNQTSAQFIMHSDAYHLYLGGGGNNPNSAYNLVSGSYSYLGDFPTSLKLVHLFECRYNIT